MIYYYALLAVIAVERLLEMIVSKANARWSFARGGHEAGQEHFPAMVLLHSCFLVGCAVEPWLSGRTELPAAAPLAFALALSCQGLRWWCIATLGRQWNTRVIVVPGLARVGNGPYRLVRHPNYLAVVVEGIALPAIGGAWITAVLFTACNACLLRTRLDTENRALLMLQQGDDHGLGIGA